jgi:hypothetical protein
MRGESHLTAQRCRQDVCVQILMEQLLHWPTEVCGNDNRTPNRPLTCRSLLALPLQTVLLARVVAALEDNPTCN